MKIILLGDSAVGKSKLVERFMMNEFQPRQVRQALVALCRQHSDRVYIFLTCQWVLQLSTFALTMFRKEVELDGEDKGKVVKVGAFGTHSSLCYRS